MMEKFYNGCVTGVERVAAWADLLDRINVFPVADGDTGRNLMLSLTPLRERGKSREEVIEGVLLAARGNSGNIAARFLAGLLTADSVQALPEAAKQGRDQAWKAVHDPVSGTMLTVLDALAEFFETGENVRDPEAASRVVGLLEEAVWSTTEQIPKLKEAGVVDAGALGIFIFLEGFFYGLLGETDAFRPISSVFKDRLEVSTDFREEMGQGWCLDLVVRPGDGCEIEGLSEYGESVVVIPHDDYVKVHLHTDDAEAARARIGAAGEIMRWEADDLDEQVRTFTGGEREPAIHIMADAAGSVTREDARRLGITLLDSYVIAGDRSAPETLFDPAELYRLMRKGVKASTAQASVFERHQRYRGVLDQRARVLYLCVGSVYTGNHEVAEAWRKENDPEGRL
ncbi:MAG: DAK2 domain-containing protein, partial [Desulfobacterales bacterium]|nr:DAK2 domain-containing protein [Desulfobacterales bacterium]